MSDITAEALEAENNERVKKLLAIGAPLAMLQDAANQVRLAVLVDFVVGDEGTVRREQFERLFEQRMAEVLDDLFEQATKPQLLKPT